MKNFMIILVCIISFNQLSAKPRKVVVVKTQPAKVHYTKPYYCKVQPVRNNVIVVKSSCPSPNHIWIDGDWIWDNQSNQYVYVEGKWIVPNVGKVWVPGHWKNTQYGWFWRKGHWR